MSSHNGHGGLLRSDIVAVPEMCYFCFEVLESELNNMDGPGTPPFTNDA